MKKIIVTILIFMFTATASVYAQLYSNDTTTENGNYSTGIFSNSYNNSERNSASGTSNSSSIGDRPGIGDGIGEDNQYAPVGDGLVALIVCSVLLIVTKLVAKKFRKRPVFAGKTG